MTEFGNEVRELTDAELEAINGGNWLGDAVRWVGHKLANALHGDGDLRRPLDSPK